MRSKEYILEQAITLQTSVGVVQVVEIEDLPAPVGGFCIPVKDESFLVVINANSDEEQKQKTFLHEVAHLLLGHLTAAAPVSALEAEADQRAAASVRLLKSGEDPDREDLHLLKKWIEQRANNERTARKPPFEVIL